MQRHAQTIGYIIFALIAIGILSRFLSDPKAMLIPVVVFGLVFYFYKFPPKRYRRGRGASGRRSAPGTRPKKKTMFRVIKGNKENDDEPPKYH